LDGVTPSAGPQIHDGYGYDNDMRDFRPPKG